MQNLLDGRYRIIKEIGRGGMGVVYLAENVRLGNVWAVKQVNLEARNGMDLLAEPNMLKRLNHPALPRIVDILRDAGSLYIIEDYIEGVPLDRVLKAQGPLPEPVVISIARQLCDALIYLHNQQPHPIIYRDMKPANIILSRDSKVKLIDFGIAREYKASSSSDTSYVGTRGYAAPEQYGTAQTDGRTDIYGLGVTLYHLITGKSPSDPPYEIKPVRFFNPGLSEGIEYIIGKCTQQDPSQRYQSAEKLLQDLNNIHTLNSAYRQRKRTRRQKVASMCLGLFLSINLAVYGYGQMQTEREAKYLQLVEKGSSESLQQAIEMMPDRLEAYRTISEQYLERKQWETAIHYIREDVMENHRLAQTDAQLCYELGTAYFNQKDFYLASEWIGKAATYDPGQVRYQRDLAVCMARQGDIDGARKIIDVIKQKGMDEAVTTYVDGEISRAQGQPQQALDLFLKAAEKTTDDEVQLKAYISAADLYKDFPDAFSSPELRAVQILEKARLQLQEKNVLVVTEMLGQAYFNYALTLGKGSPDYYQAMNSALTNFQQLIDSGYDLGYVYRNIGVIHHYMGELSQAEQAFLNMQREDPDDFRSYYELAMLYADIENEKANQNRDYSRVQQYYELTVEKCPGGENNAEISRLVYLMNDLESKGWL